MWPYVLGHNRGAAATKRRKVIMVQLEMSVLDQKVQGLRDRIQGEDDNLQREEEDRQREYANRRRPGRAAKVNPTLLPLLRGEAVSYRMLSDEINPPYGLEHTTITFGIAVSVIISVLLLSLLGVMAWAMLR